MKDDDETQDEQVVPEPRDGDESGPGDESGWAEDDDEDGWADDESSLGRSPVVLVGTFLAGLAIGVVLVLTGLALTGDEPVASSGARGEPTAGVTGSAGQGSNGDVDVAGAQATAVRGAATRLSRCADAARTLQAPLDAAEPALDQWAVHVGAMNKLVVGEITLQQAAAFWENTRVGARARVAQFREAMAMLRSRGLDCPRPELLAKGARALPACARRVDAQMRVLRAARTSVDAWDEHIHHMDMLRTGRMSAEEATRLWLAMWQRGVRELEAYRLAARGSGELDACGAAGSSD